MCDWDEEEVSSDDNEVTEVKALMALTDEERVSREDPNRDGERGFDYLTSALVSSKAHREWCRASRGGFPY
ncbi:hypothetical protein Tco_1562233, partial [Tanacetum coccineum]